MIEQNKLKTIRRRITDKLCKNPDFLKSVAGLAIEEGAIKHADILNSEETKDLLNMPTTKN